MTKPTFNPYEFTMEPSDELEYLRRFYQVMCDCDAENDLLDDLFGNDIDTWAELDHVCTGLHQLYRDYPELAKDTTP